jgi:hypothetical protein
MIGERFPIAGLTEVKWLFQAAEDTASRRAFGAQSKLQGASRVEAAVPSSAAPLVPSGQTGILPGGELFMRSFRCSRLHCPGDPGGARSGRGLQKLNARPRGGPYHANRLSTPAAIPIAALQSKTRMRSYAEGQVYSDE